MLSKMLRAASTTSDPNFNQTVLLLHGDGTNGAQNNTFLDSSTNNFTVTRNGNTTQGTFTPFSQGAGSWSNNFNGSSSLSATGANLAAGTGNFTWECWVYVNGTSAFQTFIDSRNSTNTQGLFFGLNTGTLTPVIYSDAALLFTSSINITANAWNHVALVRNSGTITLYVNGVSGGTFANTYNLISTTYGIASFYNPSNNPLNGYLSNVRVVNGTALYTSAFTPPTTPLTAITNTALLTCQSNRFVDNSSNNFTITRNGTPTIQPFSPFAPTSAYSTSVNGGSMYFDGTGDYLSTANNTAFDFGSGNFTIECWVYTGSSSQQTVIERRGTGYSTGDWVIFINESATSVVFYSFDVGSPVVVGTGLTLNSWNHIAVVRNGTTFSLYLNGISISSSTSSTAIQNNSLGITVGQDNVSGGRLYFNGYISNVRVLKGTAAYTANFTPPTAPLTAISGTSLLLSGTNAGIYDNAIKNDLVTVDNAQVSTSVKKYGTGSMSFDGTGDWLTAPDSVNLQLGTGNFTIECWVYLNAVGSARGFVSKGTSTTGWSIGSNSSNQVVFNHTSSTITSTGTLAVSTWYFVTVVREGTGTNQTKIYINGTNDGTGTVATDFNQTSIMYVGANRVGGEALNGYIDDLRITKGIARYTTTFTPPTSAFPNQ
jgi:hypothetical protein